MSSCLGVIDGIDALLPRLILDATHAFCQTSVHLQQFALANNNQ